MTIERNFRPEKRVFAGEIRDDGFMHGEVIGHLRITIDDILREYPGFQVSSFNVRHGLQEDTGGALHGYWFWEVKIR